LDLSRLCACDVVMFLGANSAPNRPAVWSKPSES
jgi:hypothetical protein